MKAFICLISAMIIFPIAVSSQNKLNGNQNLLKISAHRFAIKSDLMSDYTSPKYDTNYYFIHLSYGIAPNEVLFNKHYGKSFVSSMSHEISTGSDVIYTGNIITAGIQFNLFYQFSKQKGLNENDFQMEYYGFGMKAPKITLLYNFGNIGAGFYYPIPFDFSWFKYNIKNYPVSINEIEKRFLENYNNKFKFSSAREYGIALKAGKNFYLNLGYESRLFFPAYKFLQQQVSSLMELSVYSLCYTILVGFAMGGADLNPVLGSLIFIFPEAASFAVTELKKKSVNWPFKSDSPLYYNSFKISVNFIL